MNIINRIFLLSCISLLFTLLFNAFPISAIAQSEAEQPRQSGTGEVSGEGPGDEQFENGQQIEKAIKERPGERSLETEYNEHGVDWHDWAEKVAGAVWDPLIENRSMACGQSCVIWQVTSDCRVHIISVYSPMPDGAQVLVGQIKSLDHSSILSFPSGTNKTVVWRRSRVGGRATLRPIRGPVKVYP